MSRIAATFARLQAEGRTALMPYLMVGYPERDSALELAPALEAAGADLFEIGVPFSDPLADGATIQRAAEAALANGVRLSFCLETIAALRARGLAAPLVLMGYFNPFLRYGLAQFVADAAAAGADGLIIPDLPPEEAPRSQAAFSTASRSPASPARGASCGRACRAFSTACASTPACRWWLASASAQRRMCARLASTPTAQLWPVR
jgi:tryptophan synthase alpha subunit